MPNYGELNLLLAALRSHEPSTAGFVFNMDYAVYEDESGVFSGDMCLVWLTAMGKLSPKQVWQAMTDQTDIFAQFANHFGLTMDQVESLLYPEFIWRVQDEDELKLSQIRAIDAAHTLERFIAALYRGQPALASWEWYAQEVLHLPAL